MPIVLSRSCKKDDASSSSQFEQPLKLGSSACINCWWVHGLGSNASIASQGADPGRTSSRIESGANWGS